MKRRREILDGIEHQLERGNQLAAEMRLEFARNREAAERNSRVANQMVDRNERTHREIVKALNDLSADVQAHTAAIWAILDKMNPGGEPA